MTGSTAAAHALQQAVEKTLETVGGSGLFRSLGLERLVRDIHAAQFHPLQAPSHRARGARPRAAAIEYAAAMQKAQPHPGAGPSSGERMERAGLVVPPGKGERKT